MLEPQHAKVSNVDAEPCHEHGLLGRRSIVHHIQLVPQCIKDTDPETSPLFPPKNIKQRDLVRLLAF